MIFLSCFISNIHIKIIVVNIFTALRKTMLRAHRQAWAWQDEWYGLTMEDIRRLERETQEALAKTMKDEESDAEPSMHPSPSALSGQEVDLTAIDKDKDNESFVQLDGSPSPGRRRKTRNLSVADVGVDDGRQKLWSRSGSRTALCSPSMCLCLKLSNEQFYFSVTLLVYFCCFFFYYCIIAKIFFFTTKIK